MSAEIGQIEGRIEVQILSVRQAGIHTYATVQLRLLDTAGEPLATMCQAEVVVGRDAWILGFGPIRVGVTGMKPGPGDG